MRVRAFRTVFSTIAAMLVLAVAMAATFSGCTQDQLNSYAKAHDDAAAIRNATTQAIDAYEAELAKLPAGDPVRVQIQANIDKANKVLAQADAALATIDAAVKAVQTGDMSELQRTVSTLPVVGPYAGLIVLSLLLVRQASQSKVVHDAVTDLVHSVEAAFPDRSDAQKAQLASMQRPATQQIVSQIKGDPQPAAAA